MTHSKQPPPLKPPILPSGTQENTQLFGVSQELIDWVRQALEAGDTGTVMYHLPSHAADVADLIEALEGDARYQLIEILRARLNPEILAELKAHTRISVIQQLGPDHVAKALEALALDDMLEVLGDLAYDQQTQILSKISSRDRKTIEEILASPEGCAARLIQRNMVIVPDFWTIRNVLDYIGYHSTLPDVFYTVFVIDLRLRPVGVIPLNKVLQGRGDQRVSEIMDPEVHAIPSQMDQEQVALMFRQYGLVSAPVTDKDDRILGIITVDDIVHVIEEEATEDIMHLARLPVSDFQAPLLPTSLGRLRWLLVTFCNTLIASSVIYQFEETLAELVALAVLMPIVAAMGGNAGMQVVTITVRALATKELRLRRLPFILFKELRVGILNGLILASLVATIAGAWYQDVRLGVVLACAMIFNIIWAGLAGTLFPVALHKLGVDPAMGAGPLLTTTTDVLGFASFLGLATFFLL